MFGLRSKILPVTALSVLASASGCRVNGTESEALAATTGVWGSPSADVLLLVDEFVRPNNLLGRKWKIFPLDSSAWLVEQGKATFKSFTPAFRMGSMKLANIHGQALRVETDFRFSGPQGSICLWLNMQADNKNFYSACIERSVPTNTFLATLNQYLNGVSTELQRSVLTQADLAGTMSFQAVFTQLRFGMKRTSGAVAFDISGVANPVLNEGDVGVSAQLQSNSTTESIDNLTVSLAPL